MKCPNCQNENSKKSTHCGCCGYQLDGISKQAVEPVEKPRINPFVFFPFGLLLAVFLLLLLCVAIPAVQDLIEEKQFQVACQEAITNGKPENFQIKAGDGVLIDGAYLQSVDLYDDFGYGGIVVTLKEEHHELLSALSEEWRGKEWPIYINGELVGSPVVEGKIVDGKFVISGGFTQDELEYWRAVIQGSIK